MLRTTSLTLCSLWRFGPFALKWLLSTKCRNCRINWKRFVGITQLNIEPFNKGFVLLWYETSGFFHNPHEKGSSQGFLNFIYCSVYPWTCSWIWGQIRIWGFVLGRIQVCLLTTAFSNKSCITTALDVLSMTGTICISLIAFNPLKLVQRLLLNKVRLVTFFKGPRWCLY